MALSRGDVVVVAFPGDMGKPRPAIVVQADRYADEFATILLCPITSETTRDAPLRVLLEPDDKNGLNVRSSVMSEKVTAVVRTKIARVVGRLNEETMQRVDFSLAYVLGLI